MNRFGPMTAGVLPARRWLTLLALVVAAIIATLMLTAMLSSPADAAPPADKGGGADNSLEERLTALEEKVETLETTVATQAGQITTLNGTVATQAGQITTLNGTVATQDTKITALETANTAQDTKITALETANTAQDTKITALETLLVGVSRETVNGADTLRFSGMNVQIVTGFGGTNVFPFEPLSAGVGNLIVGYDEPRSDGSAKTGIHNLIVGTQHNYTGFGGFVAGSQNSISSFYQSVSGGAFNTASGSYSSVSGGSGNTASGSYSSVSGGRNNTASGDWASILGGGGGLLTEGITVSTDYGIYPTDVTGDGDTGPTGPTGP